MQGKQLKRLASVAALAALDHDPKSLYLTRGPDDRVLAWYYGTYYAGGVQVDADEKFETPVPLAPEYFQATASLFEDKVEVKLEFRPGAVDLKNGRRKLSLKYGPLPPSGMETFAPVYAALPGVQIQRDVLMKELALVKSVATKNLNMPILGGVRLLAVNNKFGVQAQNGTTLVYQSAVDCRTLGPDRFEVVVPVEDLSACLDLLKDEEWVGFSMDGRALVLSGENAWARTMTMAGEWPAISAALAKIEFNEPLSLPTKVVQSMVKAARALKAPPMVVIRPTEGAIVLETQETELGQFQEHVKGEVLRSYGMLSDDLDVAARISGDTVNLYVSAEKHMALVQTGDRRLFIVSRAI